MSDIPPFRELLYFYFTSEIAKKSDLRCGQWFIVTYMRKSDDNDLFMEPDIPKALNRIREYYQRYQWEM